MQTTVSDIAAVVVLLAGLATGFRLLDHARATAQTARNFTGLPAKAPVRPKHGPLVWFVAAAIAIAVVLILASSDASAAATIILAAGEAIVLGAIAWPIHRYGLACARTTAAIEHHAPVIAMPYAGVTPDHVGAWVPYVQRAGRPWCIVAQTPALLDTLAAAYDVPIVAGEIPRSVKAALYVEDSVENQPFLSARGLTHVLLGHGDSDQPVDEPERLLAYDLVAVAGQAAIERFAAAGITVPADRIRVIGRPQTEGIRPPRGPMSSIAHQRVLYAPSWPDADESRNRSSLAVGEVIIKALLDQGVTVVFRRPHGRPHHAAEAATGSIRGLLEQDAATSGLDHLWGEAASTQLRLDEAFNLVDALICDVSSIAVDFMQSEKPIAMFAAQVGTGPDLATEFRNAHPSGESAYVIDKDAINIGTILTLMLGPDPLSPSRMRRTAHYLGGEDRREPAGPFISLVRELGA